MALPKQARVILSGKWNDATCHLVCEMAIPEEFHFTGGQYVIVNSGIRLPNGKMGKRAYSIASADSNSKEFELMVKRVPEGPGSGFIHSLFPGQIFEFSGPWGQYLPPEPTPEETRLGPILVVATDTGITAALGLILGRKFSPYLSFTRLIWFIESESYFLPFNVLNSRIPREVNWQVIYAPEIDDLSRPGFCRAETQKVLDQGRFKRIYLSGDGTILRELRALSLSHGYEEEQILVETFFHHEELKTARVG